MPAATSQHHQSEGRARHGSVIEERLGTDIGDRQVGVDRPDGASNVADQALGAGARSADREDHPAADVDLVALEIVHQDRPPGGGLGVLVHALIVDVADHADHAAPVILRTDANLLAQRLLGRPPELAGELLRDHGDREALVIVLPGKVASGDEGNAHGGEVAGGGEFEETERAASIRQRSCDPARKRDPATGRRPWERSSRRRHWRRRGWPRSCRAWPAACGRLSRHRALRRREWRCAESEWWRDR